MTASTSRRKLIRAIARNAAPITAWISASGRPVLRATARVTGPAAAFLQPVRPTWPIATTFHFAIRSAPSRYPPATEQPLATSHRPGPEFVRSADFARGFLDGLVDVLRA